MRLFVCRESERLLSNKPVGCFLIRVSESRFGYSLSFRWAGYFIYISLVVTNKRELNPPFVVGRRGKGRVGCLRLLEFCLVTSITAVWVKALFKLFGFVAYLDIQLVRRNSFARIYRKFSQKSVHITCGRHAKLTMFRTSSRYFWTED